MARKAPLFSWCSIMWLAFPRFLISRDRPRAAEFPLARIISASMFLPSRARTLRMAAWKAVELVGILSASISLPRWVAHSILSLNRFPMAQWVLSPPVVVLVDGVVSLLLETSTTPFRTGPFLGVLQLLQAGLPLLTVILVSRRVTLFRITRLRGGRQFVVVGLPTLVLVVNVFMSSTVVVFSIVVAAAMAWINPRPSPTRNILADGGPVLYTPAPRKITARYVAQHKIVVLAPQMDVVVGPP